MSSPESTPIPRCEGAAVLQRVNEEAAAAVIAESMEQGPDAAATSFDLPPDFEPAGDGTYTYETPPDRSTLSFQTKDCGLCGGTVETRISLSYTRRRGQEVATPVASVALPDCILMDGCQLAVGQQHPDLFDPDKHDPNNILEKAPTPELLPCRGDRCTAVIRFFSPDGVFLGNDPQIESGECGVDIAGKIWQKTGIDTLNRMQPDPGDGFEDYDGEVVTERDIRAIEERVGISSEMLPDAEQA